MRKILIPLILLVISLSIILPNKLAAQSTCPTLPTNTGSVTLTTTIPSDGDYKIWSRMKPSNTDVNANSFFLQIDNQCAINIGDVTNAITQNTWTWVDFHSGDTSQKTIFSLLQGPKTLKIIGNEANVQVDKILLVNGNDTCIPIGVGDNCSIVATPTPTPSPLPPTSTPTPTIIFDTQNPSVSITTPLDAAIISRRSTVNITATATDNIAVDRVTFSVGGNTHTDYVSPYTYSWSVSGKPSAQYTISATAYDTSDNKASQTIHVTSNK